MAFANAHAVPTLLVDGVTGKLLGADGVDVGGTLYDVRLIDGTCISVFSRCESVSAFPFANQSQAFAAATALLDQVFLDGALGNFDSNPALTNGCTSPTVCDALTPYALSGVFQRLVSGSVNFSDEVLDQALGELQLGLNLDLANLESFVWARWDLHAVSAVPEPGTITMLGAGLLALGIIRRRRVMKQPCLQ